MNDNDRSPQPDDDTETLTDLRSLLDWLANPPTGLAESELTSAQAHLAALRKAQIAAHLRRKLLDLLYNRTRGIILHLLPDLAAAFLPLSPQVRHLARAIQDVLLSLAEDYLNTLNDDDESSTKELHSPLKRTLWRVLDALGCHLLVSHYVAAPTATGVWKMLHCAYRTAVQRNVADSVVRGAEGTPTDIYLRALLLSCAQPASFTSREIELVAGYIRRFGNRATILAAGNATAAENAFWLDPERDAPPTAAQRQPARAGMLHFSCDQLAELAAEQADALEAGVSADKLDLPEVATTPAGCGIIRRLAHYWGRPGKRRFPRRRKSYRAEICIGLRSVWQLLRDERAIAGELSNWMVTNESPDGYALMHVSGKTASLAPGDVVAIHSENVPGWQICITRWALSENPEHLELGLQILAVSATPAVLDCGAGMPEGTLQPALILSELPPFRPTETVIAPTGTASAGRRQMALHVGRDHPEVRDVFATHLDEQTASIEIIAIRPDHNKGV